MDMAFIKDQRKEVLTASAVFTLWGLMLGIPNDWIKAMPEMLSGPVSGVFSNMLGYVTMKAFGVSMDHYLVGIMLLFVAVLPLAYRERGTALQFLISGTMSVYGFLALVHLIIQPIPLVSSQVLGMGFQTLVFGLVATELYRRVLGDGSFALNFDRGLYLSSFIMALTGVTSIALLSFVIHGPEMSLVYPVGGTLLGLMLIFSSLELLENSVLGIWSSMILLTALVLASLVLSQFIVPAIIFLSAEIIIWERKDEFGDIEAPISKFRKNLGNWG